MSSSKFSMNVLFIPIFPPFFESAGVDIFLFSVRHLLLQGLRNLSHHQTPTTEPAEGQGQKRTWLLGAHSTWICTHSDE